MKITWRNVRSNKFISFINVFGLAVGLTCCMLIALYVRRELSYDQHYKNAGRVYQVATIFSGTVEFRTAASPAPLAGALKKEFPEVETFARLINLFVDDKTLVQYTEPNGAQKSLYETRGFLADSTFFQLFDFKFVEGNPKLALMEPNSIALSTDVAEKIFGKEKALNKVIHINSTTSGSLDYKVTGVYELGTKPSHIDARFIISMNSGWLGRFARETTDFASNNMFFSYIMLKPGADGKALEKKLPGFVEKYMRKDLTAAGMNKKQLLTPLKDIHLRANMDLNVTPSGNLTYLYILASIAIFILIIACINFMNLATARSAKRAAEVGVRKVLGAEKRSLIYQFLGESIVFAIISFLLAIGLTKLLLPMFASVSASNLSFTITEDYILILGFVGLTVVTGLLAGSYPAFYLSAFKPIRVLKGKFSNSLSAITFRKALVVFQFTISAALIIAAFAIDKQMNYMRTKDLGFTKDQQLVIPLRSSTAKNIYGPLKNDIKINRQITSVGGSLYYPGIFNPSDMNLHLPEKSVDQSVNIRMNWVDNSFMQTLELKPLAGRIFSDQFPADTNYRMILNEAAITKLGFKTPAEAISKHVVFDWQDSSYRFEIIGVIKDFHFQSLREPIQPYAFQAGTRDFNYLVVHMAGGDPRPVISAVEASWKKLNPTEPFEYSFLDQEFDKNYKAESRLAALVRNFMIIAITICCLGLFGLATFSAEQRTKEIGIRKVLGSSVTGIVGLLSKDFVKLVLIGNLVAIPLSWYIMQKWLQEFAFRTPLNWWVFAAAIVLSLLIALLTVSYQAIKAALMNPVSALRSE